MTATVEATAAEGAITVTSKNYAESAARFSADISAWTPPEGSTSRPVRAHQMTVLHDDGLYRHLRFQSPDTIIGWFELVTWPGALTIRGDMGSWTFARTDDMFSFFASGLDINPGYWAEKIQAGDGDGGAKKYDVELMKKQIREEAKEQLEDLQADDKEDGTDHAADFQAEIESLIEDLADDYGHDYGLVYNFEWQHPSDRYGIGRARTWTFTDTYEWDIKDWTIHYLWCCHAIRWGIEQYRAAHADDTNPTATKEAP